MKTFFKIIMLLFLSLDLFSTDSCSVTIKIDCPKGNADFWEGLILAEGKHKSYYFLSANKKKNIKKGQYLISINSDFGDRIDTLVNLESEKEHIIIKVPFKYIFESYSSSVFLTQADTIEIRYTRNACCNAYCCRDRDYMTLCKAKNGTYLVKYYEAIIRNEPCIDDNEPPKIKQKLLDPLRSKIIDEYFKNSNVPYNKKNLWLNQRVGSFKEKVKFAKWFAYLILSTKEYQNVLLSSASGSAQPNISASQIERVETLIPTHNIVESFGEIVNPLFDKMLENFNQNESLTKIRDSLLPKLMTGKIEIQT